MVAGIVPRLNSSNGPYIDFGLGSTFNSGIGSRFALKLELLLEYQLELELDTADNQCPTLKRMLVLSCPA